MDTVKKQKELEDFEKSLIGLNLSQLKAMEDKVVKEADDADKEISKMTFDLPKGSYKEVAKAIRHLLNKQTVQWQYTLGLVTMYDFWDVAKQPKKVEYAVLDSTLRTLGAMSFTGYDEWKSVVTINSYFEPLREAYVKATDKVWTIASKHNAILDRLKIFENTVAENIGTEEISTQNNEGVLLHDNKNKNVYVS